MGTSWMPTITFSGGFLLPGFHSTYLLHAFSSNIFSGLLIEYIVEPSAFIPGLVRQNLSIGANYMKMPTRFLSPFGVIRTELFALYSINNGKLTCVPNHDISQKLSR